MIVGQSVFDYLQINERQKCQTNTMSNSFVVLSLLGFYIVNDRDTGYDSVGICSARLGEWPSPHSRYPLPMFFNCHNLQREDAQFYSDCLLNSLSINILKAPSGINKSNLYECWLGHTCFEHKCTQVRACFERDRTGGLSYPDQGQKNIWSEHLWAS